MHCLTRILMAFLLLFWSYGSNLVAGQVYTPKPGTLERKEINNALRGIIEKELKKPVVFRIDSLKVQKGWAFLYGVLLEKSGKRMDYRDTPYQELIDAGLFDDWFCALLRKEGESWQVMDHALGSTDVPFSDWAERYYAPPDIFK